MKTLADLQQTAQRLAGQLDGHRQRVEALDREITALETESTLLTLTQSNLDALLQSMTAETVGKVEQLVTYGLKTVFPDQDLQFKFEVTTKFRQPWLEPKLVEGGVEAPVLEAFGGGPATLVAFILRVVVVSRMQLAPLVLIDELFSMVSEYGGYVDRVGPLLQELCRSLGLTIVFVTQQPKFVEYADIAYQVEGHPRGPAGTIFTRIVDPGPRRPLV